MESNIKNGILVLVLASFACIGCNLKVTSQTSNEEEQENRVKNEIYAKLNLKADSALIYCNKKGLNSKYCILIDFSIHSGRNRMFVWDFKGDSILYEGLCCHGIGKGSTPTQVVFSNEKGSRCSSLGHYEIKSRYVSNWGINVGYQLVGMDPTNNNALERTVTLHSHRPVPSVEIYPQHLPMGYSHGCTVISDHLMTKIDSLLSSNNKKTLLWIYE